MKSSLESPPGAQSGVALVLTLLFLVLLSVVVIGFLGTARMDRTAAGSHLERMRATSFAQAGIESVAATLMRETGDPPLSATSSTYIPRNWVSQPGALTVTDPTSTDLTRLQKQVPLSSGRPSDAYLAGTGIDLTLRPPDLNTEMLVDQSPPTHLLSEQVDPATGLAVQMKVRWIYVRKDGTYDLGTDGLPTEAPVTTNTTNPIVGRFAYWADDESAKINYNLAWTRDPVLNTNPPGHQTQVDLRALTGFTDSIANSLHAFVTADNYTTIKAFYNTPYAARFQNDSTARTALDQQKFNLTHYNSDPDTTYYGRSRMMLTTQLSNAVVRDAAGNPVMDSGNPVTRPFLDILKNPSNSMTYIDPGIDGTSAATSNVDATKLNTVINDLVTNYLKRSDWPMVDGSNHSIQEKYYSAYSGTARDQRLAQIGLNIIDYVRSAESKRTVVQPIRAKWISNVFTPDFINSAIQGTDDTFKGLTRQLHITELGMWISPTPETSGVNSGRYRCLIFTEVYLPENYGIDTLDLLSTDGAKWTYYTAESAAGGYTTAVTSSPGVAAAASNEYTVTNPRVAAGTTGFSPSFVWEAKDETAADVAKPTSKTKMAAGQYRTFATEVWRTSSRSAKATVSLRSAITVTGGPRIDVTPLSTPLSYPLDASPTGQVETTITSFETKDPRVNGVTNDWVKTAPNAATFGAVNTARTASLATPLTITPPQDLDSTGAKASSASLRMPYPFGSTQNPTGRVRSSAELGLVHTGIEAAATRPPSQARRAANTASPAEQPGFDGGSRLGVHGSIHRPGGRARGGIRAVFTA